MTRRLVGECILGEDGAILTVLPGYLNKSQVSQIVEALGVPHPDRHGNEIR